MAFTRAKIEDLLRTGRGKSTALNMIEKAALKDLLTLPMLESLSDKEQNVAFQKFWSKALEKQQANDHRHGDPTKCLICEEPFYLCKCG